VLEIDVLISSSLGELNDIFFFFDLKNSDTNTNNALNSFFVGGFKIKFNLVLVFFAVVLNFVVLKMLKDGILNDIWIEC